MFSFFGNHYKERRDYDYLNGAGLSKDSSIGRGGEKIKTESFPLFI